MSYWEDMGYDCYDWTDAEFFSEQYGQHHRSPLYLTYPSLNLHEITIDHLIFYIGYMEKRHSGYKDRIAYAKKVLTERLGEAEFSFTERK